MSENDLEEIKEQVEEAVEETIEKKVTVPDKMEKSPLQSKKFVAYLLGELTWKGLLFAMVFAWGSDLRGQATMITTIIVAGFVQVMYIGGQSFIDHYVRVARILGKEKNP